MTQTRQAPAVSSLAAIMLLGWIGAIKAVGASLATIALVDATRSLHLNPVSQSVAASSGTLAIAATVTASGLIADRIGRRRLLMISFVVASVGNLVTIAASEWKQYVLGLVISGVGLGAMFAGSYAYVKAIAPGKGLGWALGLFGAYCSIIAGVASVAGGWSTDFNWRLMFMVVPVMCVVAAVATPRLLPPMPKIPAESTDWLGLVLMGAAMVCLLIGISQSARTMSPAAWALLAGGCALLAAWIFVERRHPEPAFPIGLFRSGPFVGAVIAGIGFNVVQATSTLQLSDFWQYVGSYSVLVVTLGIQPFYIIGLIGSLGGGRLLSKGWSPRTIILGSYLMTAVGFLLLVPLDSHSQYWAFLPAIGLIGTGMMAGTTAQGQVFVQEAPHTSYGTVTSSRTTVGQLGFALGLALSTVLTDRLTFGGLTERLRTAGVEGTALRTGLDRVESYLKTGDLPTTPLGREAVRMALEAYEYSFRVSMVVCAGVMAVCAVAAWWLMAKPSRPADS